MAGVAQSNLYNEIKGIHQLMDAFVILVKTEWNSKIVDALEAGCAKILRENKIKFETLIVPGAVEIPFAIQRYASQSLPTAFIALGCVVRGDTPHFEYVCQSVTQGITQINLNLSVPTIFGILTVDTEEQALQRIGGAHGHKGEEAAITAIKMMLLNLQIKNK